MKTFHAARLASFVLAMMALGTAPSSASLGNEIVINPTTVEPAVLETTVGESVNFVNRSGRVVHVDFHHDSGYHSVFQVPGEIRAVFHRPGRHPYVIHFETGPRSELRGIVDVGPGSDPAGDDPTCRTVSVMGVCLAP